MGLPSASFRGSGAGDRGDNVHKGDLVLSAAPDTTNPEESTFLWVPQHRSLNPSGEILPPVLGDP